MLPITSQISRDIIRQLLGRFRAIPWKEEAPAAVGMVLMKTSLQTLHLPTAAARKLLVPMEKF